MPVNDPQLPSINMGGPVPEYEESADLRDYLDTILRRKWLVLSILFVSLFTTLIVSYTMQPLYKAKARIELSVQAPRVTKFEDMVGSQLQTREFIQTQLKLLQSESLAGRVIERLQLDTNPVFHPPTKKEGGESIFTGVKQFFRDILKSFSDSQGQEQQDDLQLPQLRLRKATESKFSKSLEVQPERDTTLISLAFASPDPVVARDVLNALVQEFMSWQVDKKIDSSINAKKQLEKQIEVARIQLEKAETSLNEFSRKAGIVSLNSNLNLIYSQLEEANKAFAAVQTERINKEALYNQARQGTGSLPAIVESQMIQKLRTDYITLTAEYREASVTFKDDYPKLQNLKAKTQDIERQIKNEENRIVESIKNDYLTTVKREEVLKQDTESKKALAIQLNDRATQYKIFEREVESSKLIHQSLFERSRELDARVGTELGSVQVVDYAARPLSPFTPNIPRNLLIALIAGIMGGVGLAFLLEYLDNTIKRIDEISDRFHVAILGVLPLLQADEVQDISGLVRLRPTSGFSEAIRTAKVSIQLSSSLDEPPKMLLLTSTTAGEGKSTISANLAQTFVPEEKVLLIDADLRKPSLHRLFSTNGNGHKSGKRRGLSNYLTGTSSVEEVIQESGVPNLHLIFAGPIPPNPAELLASNRMRHLLDEVDKHYDRIIIDAPPATGFADALILGHYANGVILVSTLGQTHRDALRIFRKNLMNVGGRLIGTIVNKLNVHSHYGGYYYKYYRYYRYYSYQPAYRQDSSSSPPSLTDGVLEQGEETPRKRT
ncbi:MAG: polysaccharide biosynthesis tyrosine autokinase [Syntrophobacteraceae bacterium]